MGEPLDETRPTRFPPKGPLNQESQQRNFRELEEAIIYLQQKVDELQQKIEELQT
jgi:hypothetical protein